MGFHTRFMDHHCFCVVDNITGEIVTSCWWYVPPVHKLHQVAIQPWPGFSRTTQKAMLVDLAVGLRYASKNNHDAWYEVLDLIMATNNYGPVWYNVAFGQIRTKTRPPLQMSYILHYLQAEELSDQDRVAMEFIRHIWAK